MTTVLVAEDDPDISVPLSRALEREGYTVSVATDGPSAVRAGMDADVRLVLLDIGLPGMDGLDVCRRLRDSGRTIPVMMLTARAEEADLVVGLDAGADDYVAKPFRMGEVLARVRAMLRRRAPQVLDVNGVRLETAAHRVSVEGEELSLSNKEFELLRVLMSNAGSVVTREDILAEVWNDPSLKTSKTLDMHMSWLRRKLAGPDPSALDKRIATIRGVGFRFDVG